MNSARPAKTPSVKLAPSTKLAREVARAAEAGGARGDGFEQDRPSNVALESLVAPVIMVPLKSTVRVEVDVVGDHVALDPARPATEGRGDCQPGLQPQVALQDPRLQVDRLAAHEAGRDGGRRDPVRRRLRCVTRAARGTARQSARRGDERDKRGGGQAYPHLLMVSRRRRPHKWRFSRARAGNLALESPVGSP